ncbi:MAG: hypothetical protein M0P94_03365 [Candidatus Absconditabacterales bacterium]|nr:hypothetical protein [Candidatus Absconditabacterales bacterium]
MFNFLLSFNDFYNLKNLNYKSSHNLLAEYLLQKNVKYGYSTYWNAGVLTVLSDFKTQINAINLVNNDIEPFYHLSFKKWYSPEFYQGDSVLILQNSEKMSFEYYNDFYFEENFLNYKIFYYDYNISENFSGNQKIKFVKNTKYYFNNKNRNLNQKELTGFSDIENWGVWTNNKYSFFKFKINNAKNEINNIRIKFNVLTDGRSFQNVIIKINKKEILNLKTKNSLVETEVRVKDTIKNENLFEIELENIFSPKEIGLNDDNRKLGIAINYIEFYGLLIKNLYNIMKIQGKYKGN